MGQRRGVVAAVAAVLLMSGCSALTDLLPTRTTPPATTPPTTTPTPTQTPLLTWEEVLDATRDSVVRVQTSSCDESTSLGSGFVVGDDLVMTASHVVDDGRTAAVLLGNRIVRATLVSYDHTSDSALLRTERPLGVKPLTLVTSDPVQGSELAVLGYPLRRTEVDITPGIVSGLHQPADYGYFRVSDTFITNAATNRGNSGGPVVDRRARVIGLVSGSRAWDGTGDAAIPVQGMNFIVPSPALAADLERWRRAEPEGFDRCQGDEEDAPDEEQLELEIASSHPDAPSIAGTLFVHGESINEGSYLSAWRVFTSAMKKRMGDLEVWSEGLETSYWRSLVITSVTRTGDTATAEVTLTTEQSSDAGFAGQTCSIHRMRYGFVLSGGVWLIDAARRPLDPTAC